MLYNTSVVGYYQSLLSGNTKFLRMEFHLCLMAECVNLLQDGQMYKAVKVSQKRTRRSLVEMIGQVPSEEGLFTSRFSFRPVLSWILPKNLQAIFSCMLLEKKIILVCED